jgi:hypothetical protein
LSLANGWDNVGFPIAECKSDGSVVITKPANTGGLVSKGTVCEQMIYEILDPANYTLPDVNVDFTQVTLDELQPENNSGRGPSQITPVFFWFKNLTIVYFLLCS